MLTRIIIAGTCTLLVGLATCAPVTAAPRDPAVCPTSDCWVADAQGAVIQAILNYEQALLNAIPPQY